MTQSATDKLLPCPFCGGDPDMWHGLGTQADIRCNECDIGFEFQVTDYCSYKVRFAEGNGFNMQTPSYPDEVKAPCIAALIEAWNTRHNPEANALKIAVEALKDISMANIEVVDEIADEALAEINRIAEGK